MFRRILIACGSVGGSSEDTSVLRVSLAERFAPGGKGISGLVPEKD